MPPETDGELKIHTLWENGPKHLSAPIGQQQHPRLRFWLRVLKKPSEFFNDASADFTDNNLSETGLHLSGACLQARETRFIFFRFLGKSDLKLYNFLLQGKEMVHNFLSTKI